MSKDISFGHRRCPRVHLLVYQMDYQLHFVLKSQQVSTFTHYVNLEKSLKLIAALDHTTIFLSEHLLRVFGKLGCEESTKALHSSILGCNAFKTIHNAVSKSE